MCNVDDTAPDTQPPLELSQDVQALINNGLDFLDKAREELEASKPKFSVVSFWTAVEILLKVPLAHEHWSLVCSPKKPIKKQDYLAGDFQSVTYEETRSRLKDVLEKPLDKETDSAFDKVRKHRNRVVHFYHPTFTADEQRQILKEQADAWFALNRLLREEWKVIFGVKHNWTLAFGETRLIRGNEFYAQVRLNQVKPELESLAEKGMLIGTCNECHQRSLVTDTKIIGNEKRELEVTRCKVCTSVLRQINLVCPDCGEVQLLQEGDDVFECRRCNYAQSRYDLLDEEIFHSVDEQLLSGFPAGCTNCMNPESVCKFGEGYICTRCLSYYTEIQQCNSCNHLSDSVPEFSHIRGCEFCDGDQRYFDD
ncbi:MULTISPECIES: hsdR [unclassified Citrobacter]|uniref:hsdR n=1 Tax=unclassified Citrobacter TaxID=2644389 RepID=UPI0015E51A39|nr:hsdR [Citrobacter sp. RHBSTW-00944]QLO83867.1 hsdR [Citrobacter sp. RHBSTW-00944]